MAGAGVPREADGVFEGGRVKGIAFAGALKAAEDAGVEEGRMSRGRPRERSSPASSLQATGRMT